MGAGPLILPHLLGEVPRRGERGWGPAIHDPPAR